MTMLWPNSLPNCLLNHWHWSLSFEKGDESSWGRKKLRSYICMCGEGSGTPLQYSCWKIPWTEEPGGLQSMGSQRVGHDWATSLSLFTFMHWRRKWQPTPVFLPGESQGWGSLVGCRLGSHRVGHDWSDLAVAACVYVCVCVFVYMYIKI